MSLTGFVCFVLGLVIFSRLSSRRESKRIDEFGNSLPVNRIKTEIGSGLLKGRADTRAVDKLLCLVSKDLEGKYMPNMFGNTNKTTTFFRRVGREGSIINLVVDRFPPMEAEDRTDIRGNAIKGLQGNTIDCWVVGVVKDVGDILQTEKPGIRWATGTVHQSVAFILHILVTALKLVLMLLVSFTLPTADEEVANNLADTSTDLVGTKVTDKKVHSTTISNILHKSVSELLESLHPVDINHITGTTDKDLSHCFTATNCWSVGVYSIC